VAHRVTILVVEDDPNAIKSWHQRIELHNADEDGRGFELVASYVGTRKDAEHIITERRFDAAVVDLGLKVQVEGNEHNDEGNEVVGLLASSELAAVAIYTGAPGEARRDAFPHVTVIEKGDGLDPVFDWLREQISVIYHMRDAIRIIRKDMASVFHGSIWPRWQYWSAEGQEENLVPALARHLASHTYAGLLSNTKKVHSEEHYFVPPMTGKDLSTGDLVRRADGMIEIVVTPRCDIAIAGKTETVQLAECHPIGPDWEGYMKDREDPDEAKRKKASEKIRQLQQHKSSYVRHFLPPMLDEKGASQGPWFVRFDRIRSIARDTDDERALTDLRFASISSEFLPSVVQRLGGFFSRIGTPDLS
jgi:hypothetical protein